MDHFLISPEKGYKSNPSYHYFCTIYFLIPNASKRLVLPVP